MAESEAMLMLGNEAIARGAYEAGVTVATAYPGTPSTEITEYVAQYSEINAEWSVNEKVALEIAIGASVAGARAMATMKHVGLNVAMDPLMSISYPGVNGGLVVVVADDPGQHSSQNEQDTRRFGIAAKIPVLEPSDSQECKDFIGAAFKISEQFDTPVIVRLTTRISHSQSIVQCFTRTEIGVRDFDKNYGKFIVLPAFAGKRRVLAEKRLRDLEHYAEECPLNRYEEKKGTQIIITSGPAYQYCRETAPDHSILKLGMSYPLPRKRIESLAKTQTPIRVVEELEPIFEETIKSWGITVEGKGEIPVIGELGAEHVRMAVTGSRLPTARTDDIPSLPVRPPLLCPGCHHRGVFYILKKLKLTVSGDIGCYTLAAFPPLERMDTSICMGASIPMAFGFEKARGKEFARKSVAVIGDSTFWHSGVTGLIDVVYNRGHTTVIILDNSITAMTGHQENPSTGKSLHGAVAPEIDFGALAQAIGIKHIRTVDAYNLDELETAIREETQRPAPSVIVTKQPCVLKKGVTTQKAPLSVNEKLCRACGKCLSVGCPALMAGETGKVHIDDTLCTGCEICAKVCPFGAIGDHKQTF